METLGTLREYEAVLLGGGAERACRLGLVAHAQQTAEACRLAHPASTWLQLAGLLHPLGKLLAHPRCARPAVLAALGSWEQMASGAKQAFVSLLHQAPFNALHAMLAEFELMAMM